jgi:hypothetical protein
LPDATVWPSGGNDTYYLGGLGQFPQKYWQCLEGLPSRRAVLDAASAVCVAWARELVGLSPYPPPNSRSTAPAGSAPSTGCR